MLEEKSNTCCWIAILVGILVTVVAVIVVVRCFSGDTDKSDNGATNNGPWYRYACTAKGCGKKFTTESECSAHEKKLHPRKKVAPAKLKLGGTKWKVLRCDPGLYSRDFEKKYVGKATTFTMPSNVRLDAGKFTAGEKFGWKVYATFDDADYGGCLTKDLKRISWDSGAEWTRA